MTHCLTSLLDILGNIHKLGRLLTHEWWTVVDKEGKSKERYLFLFKARILICKVRRISDDRSVFILKEIVRLPETEVKDSDENKIEIKATDEVIVLIAHKEETKKFWLKEIKQYITDVVALQEHSIDDLKIDPKQHLESSEPTIKLPQRIEAYESDQNVKPSDFAEDYTISKYSTTKATEEIKTKGTVSSIKESTTFVTEKSEEQATTVTTETSLSSQVKEQTEVKTSSKIPVLKKSIDKPVEDKPAPKVEAKAEVKKTEEKVTETVKVAEQKVAEKPKETPRVEEKPKETPKPAEIKPEAIPTKSVEEKPKTLPELKTEIVRKSPVELPPVAAKSTEKPPVREEKVEREKPKEDKLIKKAPEDPVKSELSEVEASVSEKLDRLSKKLKAIRKTETDKDVTKLTPQEAPVTTETEKSQEDLRKEEAIRESIQEKIDDDYISESSVIKRIEERYKRNYKDKDIKTLKQRKQSTDLEEVPQVAAPAIKEEVKVEPEPTKSRKPAPPALSLAKDDKPVEKLPEITKAADSNKSDSSKQSPPKEQPQGNQGSSQSGSGQDNSQGGSSGNQSNQSGSGDSRRPDKEPSPPSPGAIRLPGFFDPPPPTQYETSIEVHVKKEKYPDPPPKITRKVIVKNEELEKRTEEFLRGEIPYEKEDFSVGTAQKKIKNLKHNLGKTGDTIRFAEDTVSKARVGDFKHIKTPGTVVPERKKEPVFEYQYTVEDPKTGLCITTSEAIDFEDAEEELKKLAVMDAEHKNNQTKRVEGKFCGHRLNLISRQFLEYFRFDVEHILKEYFFISLIIFRLFK